jgi:hypothetical protein
MKDRRAHAKRATPGWFNLNSYKKLAGLDEVGWFIQIAFRRRIDRELWLHLSQPERYQDNLTLSEMMQLVQTDPVVSLEAIAKIGGQFGFRFIQDLAVMFAGDPRSVMAVRPASIFDWDLARLLIAPEDIETLRIYWTSVLESIDQSQSLEHQLLCLKAQHFQNRYGVKNAGKPSEQPYPWHLDRPIYADRDDYKRRSENRPHRAA